MIDTVIVSGGMIQKDFALDFIRKIEEERKGKKLLLLAADRGLDFFLETGLVPDIVDGDFDSLSGAGKAYLESLDHTEIVRLNPEKDDTDTHSRGGHNRRIRNRRTMVTANSTSHTGRDGNDHQVSRCVFKYMNHNRDQNTEGSP